jgi:hypothetical protein
MKRPPGRPPLDLDDPSVKLTLTLPSKQLDNLCVQAKRERLTLAEYMRVLVKAGVLKNTPK